MENFYSKSFPTSGVLLSGLYLAFDTSGLPLYTDLQPIYGGSGTEIRHLQRRLVRYQADMQMSPLGWFRL